MNIFRAPAARAAKTLDRALFANTLKATAISISDNRLISKYRKALEKTNEMLFLDKFSPIVADPDPSLAAQGKKCLVLSPQVKPSCE
jgi:tRNA (guanine37-N1)-methyltransferase